MYRAQSTGWATRGSTLPLVAYAGRGALPRAVPAADRNTSLAAVGAAFASSIHSDDCGPSNIGSPALWTADSTQAQRLCESQSADIFLVAHCCLIDRGSRD